MTAQSLTIALTAATAMCMSAVPSAAGQALPAYSITDLGSIRVTDINDHGQVVGSRSYFRFSDAIVWENGELVVLPGPTAYTWATAINNSGVIVGNAAARSDFDYAVVWHDLTNYTLLRAQAPSPQTSGMNDAGNIVGSAGHGDPSLVPWTPTVWVTGAAFDLGGPGGRAYDINNENEIVGISGDHAFYYSFTDSAWVDLHPASFPDRASRAYAINDFGLIVGSMEGDDGNRRATTWMGSTIRDIQSLPGLRSWALDVNTSGEIVGGYTASDGSVRAFYWNNTMHDLNDVLQPDDGWVLREAVAINSHGQIVGNGTANGEARAFMLDPLSLSSAEPREHVPALSLASFPNPFGERSEIVFTSRTAEEIQIDLFDALGRRVRTLYRGIGSPTEGRLMLDGSSLASGVYFCRLVGRDQQITAVLLRSQ